MAKQQKKYNFSAFDEREFDFSAFEGQQREPRILDFPETQNTIENIARLSQTQPVDPFIQQPEPGQPTSREVDPVTKQVLKVLLSPAIGATEGLQSAGETIKESKKAFQEGDIAGGTTGTIASLLRAGFSAATPAIPALTAFTGASQIASDILGEEAVETVTAPLTKFTEPETLTERSLAEIGDIGVQLLLAKAGHAGYRAVRTRKGIKFQDKAGKTVPLTEIEKLPKGRLPRETELKDAKRQDISTSKIPPIERKPVVERAKEQVKERAPQRGREDIPKEERKAIDEIDKRKLLINVTRERGQGYPLNSPKLGEYRNEALPTVEVMKQLQEETQIADAGKKVEPTDKYIPPITGEKAKIELPKDVTGTANRIVNKERLERGLNELKTTEKRAVDQVRKEAKELIESGKADPRKPNEIINNENIRLDTRQAILEYDKVTLRNDINKKVEEINLIKDPNKKPAKETELLQLENALNENDVALRSIGSEEARGLSFRRNLIQDDYSPAGIIQQARNANQGKPIPKEIRARLDEYSKRITESENKLKTLEEETLKLRAEVELNKTKRAVGLETRKIKRTAKKQELDVEYNDLIKDFVTTQTLNVGFNPQQLTLLTKMMRNRVQKGVTSIEGIVDEIFVSLADKVEGLTKRDILHAISGYGKFTELSKGQIETTLRDLRRQGRLLSAIEDIKQNKIPKKSGFEREKLSERVKELTRILNEAKQRTGITEDVKLKSYKTRLENETKRLEEMLRTGNYYKPTRKELELDNQALELVKQRDRLKLRVDREIDKINEKNKPPGTKIYEKALDVVSLLKSTVSGGEFSQTLRQGMIYALNPLHFTKVYDKGRAFREQFKYFKSEQAFQDLRKQIENDPNAGIHNKMGIDFTTLKENKLTAREEMFQSRLTKFIPWIRPFERSFTGFLDKLRLDVANDMITQFEKGGLTFKTDPKVYQAAGNWLNNATGRGAFRTRELQQMFESASPALGVGIFSPRLIVSRLQMLNPYYYARLPKPVRVRAMKDILGFIGRV